MLDDDDDVVQGLLASQKIPAITGKIDSVV
jgi:hypothetical protein